MATYLPGSGALSINDINTLFGRGNNLNAYRGTTYYTSSTGPNTFSSGAISISNFYGTGPNANTFSFSISSNQTNANLRTLAVNAGWDQSSAVIATVNSGVYIYSTSTGTPGLTINGSWPGGVTLVNNGYIMGMGGAGSVNPSTTGYAGGNAISLGVSCTITNNNYIGGGGGGGGGEFGNSGCGGGGAGGGAGGANGSGASGGSGGGPGSSGSDGGAVAQGTPIKGGTVYNYYYGGGGGGRIMPGTGGNYGTGVASQNNNPTPPAQGYARGGGSGGGGACNGGGSSHGGAGGSAGAAGNTYSGQGGGGGGGWGASGGTGRAGAGGAGGKAIALNGFTATRNGAGTTYGAVA